MVFFKTVKVEFIPPNMTLVLQPTDLGITTALKQMFHESSVLRLLKRLKLTEGCYKMSLYYTVSTLATA
jgi:hypothetical protein